MQWSRVSTEVGQIAVGFRRQVGLGKTADDVTGSFGVQGRHTGRQMVVDFAGKLDMDVVNMFFQKEGRNTG